MLLLIPVAGSTIRTKGKIFKNHALHGLHFESTTSLLFACINAASTFIFSVKTFRNVAVIPVLFTAHVVLRGFDTALQLYKFSVLLERFGSD